MVGVRKAEPLPDDITNDEIHYMLALPSASAPAISTDFVRLLRPIYKPLSCATRALRRRGGLHDFFVEHTRNHSNTIFLSHHVVGSSPLTSQPLASLRAYVVSAVGVML